MPAVSIITPAYKAEPFIVRAVRSVLAQTYTDWEMIIIVDDGGDYQKLLRDQKITDPRIRFATTSKVKAGPSVGRNIGLDMAKSTIVAHLDADDAYAEDYLSIVVPNVELHGACAGKMRLIDEVTKAENQELLVLTEDRLLTLGDMIRYNFAYVNIAFDRKRCPIRWPEELHYGEDIVLWAMLLDYIPAVQFAASARYNYYKRKGSLSHLTESADDTKKIFERLKSVVAVLDGVKPPIKDDYNRILLRQWFAIRYELEEFFDYKIVEPEVYLAELNRRYAELLGLKQ